MNKVLVLNPDKSHFDNLSRTTFESSFVFAQNYLSFLHNLDGGTWDAVYITYDLTRYVDHDAWMDGNGCRRVYNGLHAARAIASMSELGSCKVGKVFIHSSSPHIKEMIGVLSPSKIKISKYDIKEDGELLLLMREQDADNSSRQFQI